MFWIEIARPRALSCLFTFVPCSSFLIATTTRLQISIFRAHYFGIKARKYADERTSTAIRARALLSAK